MRRSSIAVALIVAGLVNAASPAAATSPSRGGTVTSASGDLAVLDPAGAGATAQSSTIARQVLGALFIAPTTATGAPVPDLATKYHFNRSGTVLQLTLRRGVRFADGTAFNASAAMWNLRRMATSSVPDARFLSSIATMKATSPTAMTITFSVPMASFVTLCATTSICEMASPASFASLGASAFASSPVGAGPFIVQSHAGSRLVLIRNPSYWDAKHVYLDRWILTYVSADQAAYQTLLQDGIQALALPEIGTAPSLLFQASANANLDDRVTPSTDYSVLALNSVQRPFNDQRARVALDYCVDRSGISLDTTDGYASPTYVLAGNASAFLPAPGGARGSQTLMPYRHDVTQASSFVAQIGGLSFTLEEPGGQAASIVASLAAQLAVCGIHVQVVEMAPSAIGASIDQGSDQAAYLAVPGLTSPQSSLSLEEPASALIVSGVADPKLSVLVRAAMATSSPSRLAKTWQEIWYDENADAVVVPLLSSGVLVLTQHCLRDVTYQLGFSMVHAWLACRD